MCVSGQFRLHFAHFHDALSLGAARKVTSLSKTPLQLQHCTPLSSSEHRNTGTKKRWKYVRLRHSAYVDETQQLGQ